jgi:DNA-binding NtrC family response regulator
VAQSRPAVRPRARPAGLAPGAPEGDPLIGRSRAITRVLEQIQRIATTHAAVLIEGEPGTGKGAAARAIHDRGPRHAEAFVALDGAEIVPTGQEEALFGAQAGGRATPGAVERAEGGTLYLAEVGALSHAVQARLLRLLQERAYERIGGERTLHADVRLIAGTRQDLAEAAREGRFRDDLLARIAAARITMPPLRERVEDVPALVERFLREANRRHRRGVKRVTRGVLERLERHPWPGNVRELADTIEGMVVSAPGGRPLDLADLPEPLRVDGVGPESVRLAPGMTVEEAVRGLIVATLEYVGQDRRRAAAMLGIGLRTLYRKIKQYGIG